MGALGLVAIVGFLAAGVGGTVWAVRRRRDRLGGLALPEGARLVVADETTVKGVPSKTGGAPVDTTLFLQVPIPAQFQSLPQSELDMDMYVGWNLFGEESNDDFQVARRQFVGDRTDFVYLPVRATRPVDVDLDVGLSARDGRSYDLAEFRLQFR